MAKYNIQKVKQVTDLIREGGYPVHEICSLAGISKQTYYRWLDTKSDFSDAIQGAKREFDEKLVVAATRSLFKLVTGYYVTEEKRIFNKPSKPGVDGIITPDIKTLILNTRYIHPSLGAIIFVLTNKDPQNWKNTFRVEVTGKDGVPIKMSDARNFIISISDKALDEKLEKLKKLDK